MSTEHKNQQQTADHPKGSPERAFIDAIQAAQERVQRAQQERQAT